MIWAIWYESYSRIFEDEYNVTYNNLFICRGEGGALVTEDFNGVLLVCDWYDWKANSVSHSSLYIKLLLMRWKEKVD